MRTRLLTRLERRGRPAYVSAYLKYVMTLRPRMGIGHPWGGALRAGTSCSGPLEKVRNVLCVRALAAGRAQLWCVCIIQL